MKGVEDKGQSILKVSPEQREKAQRDLNLVIDMFKEVLLPSYFHFSLHYILRSLYYSNFSLP